MIEGMAWPLQNNKTKQMLKWICQKTYGFQAKEWQGDKLPTCLRKVSTLWTISFSFTKNGCGLEKEVIPVCFCAILRVLSIFQIIIRITIIYLFCPGQSWREIFILSIRTKVLLIGTNLKYTSLCCLIQQLLQVQLMPRVQHQVPSTWSFSNQSIYTWSKVLNITSEHWLTYINYLLLPLLCKVVHCRKL